MLKNFLKYSLSFCILLGGIIHYCTNVFAYTPTIYISPETEDYAEMIRNTAQEDTILLQDGIYTDLLEIPKDTHIEGENQTNVLLQGGVILHDGSVLKDVTVENLGVQIYDDADVALQDVIIQNTSTNGITTRGLGLLTLENVTIKHSQKKGLYLNWGKHIDFDHIEIASNQEEGLDLRANIAGSITNSSLKNNGESGLEIIIGDANVILEKNVFYKNGANGISFQFYRGFPNTGTITLYKNTFEANHKNGIDCKRTSGSHTKENYWKDSIIYQSNVFLDTNHSDITTRCESSSNMQDPGIILQKISPEGYSLPFCEECTNLSKTEAREKIEKHVTSRSMEIQEEFTATQEDFAQIEISIEKQGFFSSLIFGPKESTLESFEKTKDAYTKLQTEFEKIQEMTLDPELSTEISRLRNTIQEARNLLKENQKSYQESFFLMKILHSF